MPWLSEEALHILSETSTSWRWSQPTGAGRSPAAGPKSGCGGQELRTHLWVSLHWSKPSTWLHTAVISDTTACFLVFQIRLQTWLCIRELSWLFQLTLGISHPPCSSRLVRTAFNPYQFSKCWSGLGEQHLSLVITWYKLGIKCQLNSKSRFYHSQPAAATLINISYCISSQSGIWFPLDALCPRLSS